MLTDIQLGYIPEELKGWDHWVIWRYGVKSNGQETKIPYQALRAERADSMNPATWSSYEDAVTAMRRTQADGIGFVFGRDDPYIGVDLDDCYDASRAQVLEDCLDPDESRWVLALNSYTEVSPSGTGVKVIFRGQLPKDLDRHSF